MAKATLLSEPAGAKALSQSSHGDLVIARGVVEHARHGLDALSRGLGEDFIRAVDIFVKATGRVIVSGMGKSGHVARKIAATLASTGTPAQFVHPAEASHGDLGMIAAGDAVLAISNSGETPELGDIVSYSRRFAIPLVAITGRARSSLGTSADATLILPDVGEAGSLGLAPTTSTTLMMCLGDALAVALLERRGFTSENFKVFHPGGQLGRKLYKVSDLMHVGDELPLVTPAMSMVDVIPIMTSKTFGVAGVVDADGNLIGVITDGDLRRHIKSYFTMTAGEIMTKAPRVVPPGMLAAEAVRHMYEWKVTSLFIVDGGKPVGIVRMHDIGRSGAV